MSVPANGKTAEEFVTERLGLSNGTETSVGNLLSVKLNTVLRKPESLLDKGRQLSDSPSLLTENILGTGGSDDNLCPHGSDPNLHTWVTILCQLSSQNLVQLCVEHTVRYKLQILNTVTVQTTKLQEREKKKKRLSETAHLPLLADLRRHDVLQVAETLESGRRAVVTQ